MLEKTLAILKPDALKRNLIGKIISKIEDAGLKILAVKLKHLSQLQAQQFYAVHAQRPFFQELCTYMSSGPVFIAVLEGENAVERYRNLMGATNPAQAQAGTIRAEFGLSIGENTVHGSDSLDNARVEIAYFFSGSKCFQDMGK